MTRFFYTDPLAAAWMAKHFWIQFVSADGRKLFPMNTYPANWAIEDATHPRGDTGYSKEIFYVHPDSLHLLEPQKHDLVDFGWIHPCGQSFHEMTLLRTGFEAFCEKSTCDYDSHRIIQRNGKAFHWPESESA